MSGRRLAALILVISLGLVGGCSSPETESGPKKLQITGAGATFPYPLYKEWIQEYQKIHPDIKIVYEPVGSGTTYAFTNHLSAISEDWRDRGPGVGKVVKWPAYAMRARWNEGVAGRIKNTDGAIGYVEYSYAKLGGLAMAALENRAGKFIELSFTCGKSTLVNTENHMPANLRIFFPEPPGESSYPIITYSWIMLYKNYLDQQKEQALKDFVTWGVTQGQNLSEKLEYCSLPAQIVARARESIAAIK
jgi:phosphate transport system substrate-binding protein